MKYFYVFSEGYHIDEINVGNLEIQELDCVIDEDGDIIDYEVIEHLEQEYITDKWGGEKITKIPEEAFAEFTNGLIQIGHFENKDEAYKAFNDYILGEITWTELSKQ